MPDPHTRHVAHLLHNACMHRHTTEQMREGLPPSDLSRRSACSKSEPMSRFENTDTGRPYSPHAPPNMQLSEDREDPARDGAFRQPHVQGGPFAQSVIRLVSPRADGIAFSGKPQRRGVGGVT